MDVLQQNRHRRRGGKGRLAGEQFVGHDAEAVDVTAEIDRRPRRLFGRHVFGRAGKESGARQRPAVVVDAGESEITDRHASVGVHQQISGLDVAMHHAARVRVVERRRGVAQDLHRLGGARTLPRDRGANVAAGEQPHAHPRYAFVNPSGVDRHNVGMLEASDHACLLGKPSCETAVVEQRTAEGSSSATARSSRKSSA